MILSVEGNIGSGKSTFVEFLRENIPNAVFLQEPVNEWNEIKDKNGETMLAKFYKDQTKYSFPFQMMAYISRLSLLKETVEKNPGSIIITERCLDTDRQVFAKMLYDDGNIEEVEYQIYLRWFDNFKKDFPISHHIYLKTEPDIAHKRVLKRNRSGETIAIEYLQACNQYHNDWLEERETEKKVVTINANQNEDSFSDWLNIVRKIIG
jgi:deoxyadenosine/deoxycytidine kinase